MLNNINMEERKIDYVNQNSETFEERFKSSSSIRQKFPDRLPLVITKSKKSDLEQLEKVKYIVPHDMSTSDFSKYVRKTIKLPAERELFLLINDEIILIPDTKLMNVIYEKHKCNDGFLRIYYTSSKKEEIKEQTKEENKEETKEQNKEEYIQEFSDEQIENNLKVLSELKPYEKLWISEKSISKNNSYWITRKLYSQSRDVSVEMIIKLYNYLFQYKKQDARIITLINESKEGLKNLKITYPDKASTLDEIIEKC